jgi:hypothetical protein
VGIKTQIASVFSLAGEHFPKRPRLRLAQREPMPRATMEVQQPRFLKTFYVSGAHDSNLPA